jgi:hypothetical protein
MTQKTEGVMIKLIKLIATASVLSACSQLPTETTDNASLTWMEVEPEPFAYQDQSERYKYDLPPNDRTLVAIIKRFLKVIW